MADTLWPHVVPEIRMNEGPAGTTVLFIKPGILKLEVILRIGLTPRGLKVKFSTDYRTELEQRPAALCAGYRGPSPCATSTCGALKKHIHTVQ